MIYQKISAFLFCLLLFGQISAQVKPSAEQKKSDVSAELKKEAISLLREAAQDVANLRTPENRIGFSAEIASLMWFEDEKQARAMFQSVVTDFRQMLIQIDAQYTALGVQTNDEIENYDPLFGAEPTAQAKLARKLRIAMSVRQQIALSIAEHDPQMAYDFFIGTSEAVTNSRLRSVMKEGDSYFELNLLNAIAEKDPDKALEAGRKMLAKGFNYQIINLLKKIYEKDAEQGASFGDEIVRKVKSEEAKGEASYQYGLILNSGAENLEKLKATPGKKPMFSEQALREIADLLAQEILKLKEVRGSEGERYISLVEKFSPARAEQVKLALASRKKDSNEETTDETNDYEMRMKTQMKAQQENKEREEKLIKDVQNLSANQITKEEREKIISQARQSVSKMKSDEQKIFALSLLASQIARTGDKELAAKIMDDAAKLVEPQPKNYRDFLQVWMLASGYSQVDADKAFPILEDAVFRINDTISALIKVGEFMDANEEIIENGEVQIGGFGGNITREMLGSLGAASPALQSLATADFARTRALTNKFDRIEARILAKMLILRAVLGEQKIAGK